MRSTLARKLRLDALFASSQKKLDVDPSAEVYIEAADGKDMRGLTSAEANTILSAALAAFSPTMTAENNAARRWVARLCAYTGARLNEITQLRAMDVLEVDGVWCVNITPDAGPLKNEASKRIVPLHPHLVEQGFVEFARARTRTERLFYAEARTRAASPGRNVGNKLGEWVRGLGVVDPEVAPFHGWRHRFKTEGRRAGMDLIVLDAIQGHAPRTEGEKYGAFPPDVMLREIRKYPRYQVEAAETVDGRRKPVKARKKAMAVRQSDD